MSNTRSNPEGPSRKYGKAIASVLLSAWVAVGAASPERSRGAEKTAGAAVSGRAEAAGVMAARGEVWLQGVAAPGTSAVYEGDTVRTAREAAAVMRLRSGMRVALEEQGEVVLAGSELRLKQGVVTVSQAGAEAGRIEVLGREVKLRGQGGAPAVARIAAMGGVAELRADQGEMEIVSPDGNAGARPVLLHAGEVARLVGEPSVGGVARRMMARRPARAASAAGGAPQAAVKKAGTVSGEIPSAEIVERQGVAAKLPLHLNDNVNWQDLVETLEAGRVRIQLLDGSVLNVGARSKMQIVSHNPQTQQTQVELTLGRIRSQVVKLTKPGASFQMKTQTAVIGVVGTIFVVEASEKSTRVICIEGRVTVTNINPAVQGQVQLGPGQSTVVDAGLAPTAATATNATELQTAMNRTEVEPGFHSAPPPGTGEATEGAGTTTGGAAPGTTGATGGTTGAVGGTVPGTTGAGTAGGAATGVSGAGSTLSIGSAAAAVAGGVSAVAGVTAISKANDANSALNQANAALANATSISNAATTAIDQSKQSTVSPSTPCGCGP